MMPMLSRTDTRSETDGRLLDPLSSATPGELQATITRRLERAFADTAGNEPWLRDPRALDYVRIKLVAATVAALAPKRILEVGCGAGALTCELAQQEPRPAITAFDVSLSAVTTARNRVAAAQVLVATPPALPFAPTDAFDVCVLSEMFYYVPLHERAAALEEIARASRYLVSCNYVGRGHRPGAIVEWQLARRFGPPDVVLPLVRLSDAVFTARAFIRVPQVHAIEVRKVN
jgi:SAM-dependent methyltransferase